MKAWAAGAAGTGDCDAVCAGEPAAYSNLPKSKTNKASSLTIFPDPGRSFGIAFVTTLLALGDSVITRACWGAYDAGDEPIPGNVAEFVVRIFSRMD